MGSSRQGRETRLCVELLADGQPDLPEPRDALTQVVKVRVLLSVGGSAKRERERGWTGIAG